MNNLMEDIENVLAYLDDVLCVTKGDFDDHLTQLEKVLKKLHDAGLKVNLPKCYFARGELEYLGYW
eukprot:scaffold23398_cov186-Cylindrotheca_fusiformis.AAC.1